MPRVDIPVRIPEALLDEAGELVPLVQATPALAIPIGTVTKAAVVRVALQRGLADVRRECEEARKKS